MEKRIQSILGNLTLVIAWEKFCRNSRVSVYRIMKLKSCHSRSYTARILRILCSYRNTITQYTNLDSENYNGPCMASDGHRCHPKALNGTRMILWLHSLMVSEGTIGGASGAIGGHAWSRLVFTVWYCNYGSHISIYLTNI